MLKLWITLSVLAGERMDRLRDRDDEGATAVEYGLMVALIAVIIITAVGLLGTNLDTKFRSVCAAVKGSAC